MVTSMRTPSVWLVLGPEPEVDTTFVAQGLIIALRRRGAPAVGMKPIDIGCAHADDHDLDSVDGERLWNASERALPPLVVAPYRFAAGDDPVQAAARSGLQLTLRDVLATIEEASRFGGPVVVVGPPRADGPFVADGDAWSLARATSAQVVVVVDEANADRLDDLTARADREGLQAVAIYRRPAATGEGLHLPPDVSTPEAAADVLASALD